MRLQLSGRKRRAVGPLEENSVENPKRKRLHVGEGDFHYTVAWAKKHPRMPEDYANIVATDIEGVESIIRPNLQNNLQTLKKIGVKVAGGVDAKFLHITPGIAGKRYPRIQFNFPYIRQDWSKSSANSELMRAFFQSAAALQYPGDQIHVVIPQRASTRTTQFFEGRVYGLGQGSLMAGYSLKEKRRFNKTRYPEYQHNKTGESAPAVFVGVEYVFSKKVEGPMSISEYAKANPLEMTISDARLGEVVHYSVLENLPIMDESSCDEAMPLDVKWVKKGLLDKRTVLTKVKSLIDEGQRSEASELLSDILDQVSWYWDIDGGMEALSLLGDQFCDKHAKFVISRVYKDASWRGKGAKDLLVLLSKSITTRYQGSLLAMYGILLALYETDSSYKDDVIVAFNNHLDEDHKERVFIKFLSNLLHHEVAIEATTIADIVSAGGKHTEKLKQCLLMAIALSIGEMSIRAIKIDKPHSRKIFETILDDRTNSFVWGLEQHYVKLSAAQQDALIQRSLQDKAQVLRVVTVLIKHKICSKLELSRHLLRVTASKISDFWDVDGGIAALSCLGDAFQAKHAEYFISRLKRAEGWCGSHILSALESLASTVDSQDSIQALSSVVNAIETKGLKWKVSASSILREKAIVVPEEMKTTEALEDALAKVKV
ncbi:DUF2431 domain-containing protein [Candidatus Synchoanobacter obligatus]|uniref:DUF2431 domain-containing protein n=1 Tax=Candidatus Synchoanobacter obligatus TaxID=2919597 RepID=A0ABT1L4H0_9GAMM|nr:DUF2431 domain-containing protein [Candidatus Synchoanobacter obligatus]MCP8351826.1 DUF2431 domain-containing protein [Candidatus Synchoanobacter obligatus]